MRKAALVAVTAAALLAACTDKNKDDEVPLSQRERDSIIGESRLPGASGIRRAQAAADSADALNRALEAIAGGQ
jgi:hypothetical protein